METLLTTTIIHPELKWIDPSIPTPLIYYSLLPHSRHDVVIENLLPGASWTFCLNTPQWPMRRAVFEDNYFPYDFKFYYLPVQNGQIILEKLNLCFYTDLHNPSIVYMKLNDKILQSMEFRETHINLTEFYYIE